MTNQQLRRPRRTWRRVGLTAITAMTLIVLAACGSGGEAGDAGAGSGSKKMVLFTASTANVYISANTEAVKKEAKALGYDLTVISNEFDQAQEDQQIQQYLASGEKPAAFLIYPPSAEASVNSLRQLSRVAPVFQWNQAIAPDAEDFVAAYIGTNDKAVAEGAAENAMKARDEAVADGFKLHSEGGNMIELGFPAGLQAGIDRHDAFAETTKDAPFNIFASEPTLPDAQSGFQAMTSLIPKYKSAGIDFVWAMNNDLGVGAVRALKQAGYKPGKDVFVIAGNFSGDKAPLAAGEIYSAQLQSPVIEGMLTVRTAVQYIEAGGKTTGETVTIPFDENDPGLQSGPPARVTYMPHPTLTPENYDSVTMWGLSEAEMDPS